MKDEARLKHNRLSNEVVSKQMTNKEALEDLQTEVKAHLTKKDENGKLTHEFTSVYEFRVNNNITSLTRFANLVGQSKELREASILYSGLPYERLLTEIERNFMAQKEEAYAEAKAAHKKEKEEAAAKEAKSASKENDE